MSNTVPNTPGSTSTPVPAKLTPEAVIAQLRTMRSQIDEVAPLSKEQRTLVSAKTQLETGQEPFLAGNVGMAGPFGLWKAPVYRNITGFDWDLAPLPHGRDAPPRNGVFTAYSALLTPIIHILPSPRQLICRLSQQPLLLGESLHSAVSG